MCGHSQGNTLMISAPFCEARGDGWLPLASRRSVIELASRLWSGRDKPVRPGRFNGVSSGRTSEYVRSVGL